MSDMKLLFNGIDRIAANAESESSMVELCRAAIVLHIEANAYDFLKLFRSEYFNSRLFI